MAVSRKSKSKSKSKSTKKINSSRHKKSNNTNTRNNSNSNTEVSKCGSKYCKKVFLPRMKKMLANISKGVTKKFTPEEKAKFNKTLKDNAITDSVYIKKCINTYCNPNNCKNTIFEAGSKVPNSIFVKLKAELEANPYITKKDKLKIFKNSKKTMTEMRKSLFKNKTNVVKNNFYENLSPKDVKQMKKEGAISGCTIMKMF